MTTAPDTAVYVYCVCRAPRRPRIARDRHGVPGATVPAPERVAPTLWLVASAVPLDVYGPGNLEPRLRDLDWVADVAVAHEAVTESVARGRGVVVVPMKMFTMFSTLEKAGADVRARRAAIDRVIRHIAGCEEWGVRVTRQAAVAAPEDTSPRTGAGFLRARKAARDAAATAHAGAVAAAETAFDRLTRLAKDANRRARRSEPGTNPPILEAAFLVRAGGRARFTAEARRQTSTLAKAGADLTLTGPWPAYNFVGSEAVT
ncbi:MAG TPA: GvpL/GvpF family gas vesicle protein [Vicinamibacterales bacterium]